MAVSEQIHSIYREVFGRDADPLGLALRGNQSPEEIRADLFASEEYRRLIEGRERQRRESEAATERERQDRLRTEETERTRRDAHARISDVLSQYGLGDLSGWVWSKLTSDASESQVFLELQDQPTFKTRFKAIEQRRAKGLPAISPAEVIRFENAARSLMRASGLPEGFFDSPDDFTNFLVNDVSPAELGQRVSLAERAVFNEDPTLRAERARFGITPGEEVAMVLDASKAFPALARRFASAGLSAQGVRTGFGQLSMTEAGGLLDLGVTEEQAAQGFGTLAASRELFTPLVGTAERDISRETQFGAVFGGSAQAREEIEKRAKKRRSPFEGGGAFSQTREGFVGLGRSR